MVLPEYVTEPDPLLCVNNRRDDEPSIGASDTKTALNLDEIPPLHVAIATAVVVVNPFNTILTAPLNEHAPLYVAAVNPAVDDACMVNDPDEPNVIAPAVNDEPDARYKLPFTVVVPDTVVVPLLTMSTALEPMVCADEAPDKTTEVTVNCAPVAKLKPLVVANDHVHVLVVTIAVLLIITLLLFTVIPDDAPAPTNDPEFHDNVPAITNTALAARFIVTGTFIIIL